MVSDALGELFPFIDMESQIAELVFLSDTKRGITTSQLNASVGNLNHHQLFNPVGSANLVILTRVDIRLATGQLFEFDVAALPLTNISANHRLRDTRDSLTAQPVGQVRDVQQAAGLPAVGSIIVQAGVNLTIEDSNGLFVLAPGTGVTFATTVANTTGQVMFWWRERVAQLSELQF